MTTRYKETIWASFLSQNKPYKEVNTQYWTYVGSIIWPGSGEVATIQPSIKVSAYCPAGANGELRIYDPATADILSLKTGIDHTELSVIDLINQMDFPTTTKILEIHARVNVTGCKIRVAGIRIAR